MKTNNPTSEKIATLIKGGNQKEFNEVYKEYNPRLYGFMLSQFAHQIPVVVLDDLCAEVWSKICKNISKFRPQFAFSTWIMTIARNHCLDFIRSSDYKLFSNTDSIETAGRSFITRLSLPSAETKGTDASILDSEQLNYLIDAVVTLDPKHKCLLIGYHFDQLSYDELAALHKIPIGTVKARLFLARDLLRKILFQNAYFHDRIKITRADLLAA